MSGLFKLVDNVYAVVGQPALYLSKYDTLVVADLHLGFEESYASQGIFVPTFQLKKIFERIKKILSLVVPVRVIINGDIKHDFSRLLRQERREIRNLIDFLKDQGIEWITVIRGNHDNYASIVLDKLGVKLVDVLILENIVLTHGHLDLSPEIIRGDIVIIGNEHPSIAIKDDLGLTHKFTCLVLGSLTTKQKVIIMPSLSFYASGNPVTLDRETYLSPLIKKYGLIEQFKPYIVDENIGILELPTLKEIEHINYFE